MRSLFWRLFLINGLVFVAGTLVLAIAPVTVSTFINPTEIPVIAVGLVVILLTNALLVRAGLRRLDAEYLASGALALAAQEGERQRISRELHDEIGQSLTVALLSLRRVADRAPESLREETELAQQAVRKSLDDVRQVARRLRPAFSPTLVCAAHSKNSSRSSPGPAASTSSARCRRICHHSVERSSSSSTVSRRRCSSTSPGTRTRRRCA